MPAPRSWRVCDLLGWAAGRRLRFRIAGASMVPTLEDGAQVLVDPRAFRRRPPRAGDVVLARHPYRRDVQIVKRVAEVTASGRLVLRGDNPRESTDSRAFGAVSRERLLGQVVCRLV